MRAHRQFKFFISKRVSLPNLKIDEKFGPYVLATTRSYFLLLFCKKYRQKSKNNALTQTTRRDR